MDQVAVKRIWRHADAVCFDYDSTVVVDEGLDELANFCGVGEQVKQWTLKAMGGSVTFREALKTRLNIVQPTLERVNNFVQSNPPRFTPGMIDLAKILIERGTQVFLVSGGFRRIIEPAAVHLGLPVENIFANKLIFNSNGEYNGFDEDEPTSESGGKARVAQILKDQHNFKNLVFIGDGATDLEASPPADAFIGFGGNVVRDKVKDKSLWFVTDFQELIKEIAS